MQRKLASLDARVRTALVICLCFLLSSTGWLSWFYRVMELARPESVEFLTIVVGYLVQALGTGAYLWMMRGERRRFSDERVILASLALSLLVLVPATLTQSLALTLGFGYLSNALFGIMQGSYLALLCAQVDHVHRSVTFGSAYAVSTLASWLLSLPEGGMLARGVPCLGCCLVMSVAACAIVCAGVPAVSLTRGSRLSGQTPGDTASERQPSDLTPGNAATARQAFSWAPVDPAPTRQTLLVAGLVVVIASAVRTAGFSFPAADLSSGVSIELSRLFYGIGLVGAGLASDRDRRLGLAICIVSLVMPFLMMALSGAGAQAMPLWAIAYLFAGIYVLFCVLLWVDLAERLGRPQLAGIGMCLRHVGDALGTCLSLSLAGMPMALIAVASMLFVAGMGLFFVLYQQLLAPVPQVASTGEPASEPDADTSRDRFERFAAQHSLTARERDILRLVLAEKTNAEIAGELVVSERTVKFHMTNLLKKTDCKTRLEILAAYAGADSARKSS